MIEAGTVGALFTADTKLNQLTSLADKSDKVLEYLDKKDSLSLYDYLFLRRVNSAFSSCGEQGSMQPVTLLSLVKNFLCPIDYISQNKTHFIS